MVPGGSGVKLYLDFRGQAPVRKFLFRSGFGFWSGFEIQAPVSIRVSSFGLGSGTSSGQGSGSSSGQGLTLKLRLGFGF